MKLLDIALKLFKGKLKLELVGTIVFVTVYKVKYKDKFIGYVTKDTYSMKSHKNYLDFYRKFRERDEETLEHLKKHRHTFVWHSQYKKEGISLFF